MKNLQIKFFTSSFLFLIIATVFFYLIQIFNYPALFNIIDAKNEITNFLYISIVLFTLPALFFGSVVCLEERMVKNIFFVMVFIYIIAFIVLSKTLFHGEASIVLVVVCPIIGLFFLFSFLLGVIFRKTNNI